MFDRYQCKACTGICEKYGNEADDASCPAGIFLFVFYITDLVNPLFRTLLYKWCGY
jgi:hypothetical protein